MSRVPSLEQIFDRHLRLLSTTLRPGTLNHYRCVARHFLAYLRTTFPHLSQPSQLRRDPHLVGRFRCLCEHHPPLCNATRTNYLLCLRRLLQDLAKNSPTVPLDLIRSQDFPPPAHYLPRPLSPPEDQRLQQELRRIDNLTANALLLTRATGMRIGECSDLPLDCLQQVGLDQWALHVPLGKLHTERLVPADAEVRRIVARILTLRASALPATLPPRETLLRRRGPPPEPLPAPLLPSEALLLPRCGRRRPWFCPMRSTLAKAAQRAGCSGRVVPHRLRHSVCHRDAPTRGQPPGPDAAARPQGHPHDLTVRTGDTTGLAARISPGPPAGGSTPSHPRTLTPSPHYSCRSSGNPPGAGGYASSPGDVSPPAR